MKLSIMSFFGKKKETSSTGIFIVDHGTLRAMDKLPENNSINGISESLGLPADKVHVVFTFDSKIISFIAFKKRTKDPIFFSAKDKDIALDYSDVKNEISKIDWAFEYRQLDFEDGLK